jgi:hypothetical protein
MARGRTTWTLLALLTLASAPLGMYDLVAGRWASAPLAVVPAAISVGLAVCLLLRMRWALWLTVFRFTYGLVAGFLGLGDAIELRFGGWDAVPGSVATRIYLALGLMAVGALAAFIGLVRLSGASATAAIDEEFRL